MARTLEAWTTDVREAALANDEGRLRTLFSVGRHDFGAEEAAQAWRLALDGLDASAVTG
jgi:hypothetical protein